MFNPSYRPHRVHWLGLGMLSACLVSISPAWAGSSPAGGGSGVTTGGSTLLPPGSSPITPEFTTSAAANVVIDPVTGDLSLINDAQASLDAAALELLRTLESRHPGLVTSLTTPLTINLDQSVGSTQFVIASPLPGTVPAANASLGQWADAVAAAIAAYRSVTVTTADGTLTFSNPLVVLDSPGTLRTTVTYTPADGSAPFTMTLRGSADALGNAAAFLAAAIAAGATPEEVEDLVPLVLAGADYDQVIALVNVISGLLVAVTDADAATSVNPSQLNRAIFAYNAIVASVDESTLTALAAEPDFVALGEALRQLRAAIDS